MRFVIVTGMSGQAKVRHLKMLEDVGYFCVDNLPVPLIPKMADLLEGTGNGDQQSGHRGGHQERAEFFGAEVLGPPGCGWHEVRGYCIWNAWMRY